MSKNKFFGCCGEQDLEKRPLIKDDASERLINKDYVFAMTTTGLSAVGTIGCGIAWYFTNSKVAEISAIFFLATFVVSSAVSTVKAHNHGCDFKIDRPNFRN